MNEIDKFLSAFHWQ